MHKAKSVISTIPDRDKSTKEHFTEVYRQIGLHFINNAERFGNNVVDNVSGIDVFISLEPNSVVTIDISQKEALVKQGLSVSDQDNEIDRVIDKINKKVMEVMDNE